MPKNTKTQPKAQKKKKKLIPKKEKHGKIIKEIIKWTILIALLLGSIAYIMMSPLFNVHQINVENNKKISAEEIISLSEIQLGENTYKISKSATIGKIKQNPYIETVIINRKLPDIINIIIEERKPELMIEFANAYVYIDKKGYILEISQDKLELPIIENYNTATENIKLGNRLIKEDLEQIEILTEIMDVAENVGIDNKITKVNFSDKSDYKLILEEEQKIVHLGDLSDINVKMLYLKSIIEKEQGNKGEIFLNVDLNKHSVYFREEK